MRTPRYVALARSQRVRDARIDPVHAPETGTWVGFVEAVTGADRDVGTDLPRACSAQAHARAAGFF